MLCEGIGTLHWRQTGSGRLCTSNLRIVSAGFRQKDVGSFEAWDRWDLTYLAFFWGMCRLVFDYTTNVEGVRTKKNSHVWFFCCCFFGYRAQILGEQVFSSRDSFFSVENLCPTFHGRCLVIQTKETRQKHRRRRMSWSHGDFVGVDSWTLKFHDFTGKSLKDLVEIGPWKKHELQINVKKPGPALLTWGWKLPFYFTKKANGIRFLGGTLPNLTDHCFFSLCLFVVLLS